MFDFTHRGRAEMLNGLRSSSLSRVACRLARGAAAVGARAAAPQEVSVEGGEVARIGWNHRHGSRRPQPRSPSLAGQTERLSRRCARTIGLSVQPRRLSGPWPRSSGLVRQPRRLSRWRARAASLSAQPRRLSSPSPRSTLGRPTRAFEQMARGRPRDGDTRPVKSTRRVNPLGALCRCGRSAGHVHRNLTVAERHSERADENDGWSVGQRPRRRKL